VDAALNRTLVPFIGAGASRIGGCPNWTEFADGALRFFCDAGKFNHAQLAQLENQPARIKLSIALALQREHGMKIEFETILYPEGRNNAAGRLLYENLSKLGNVFVTTNYDSWLHTITTATPKPDSEIAPAVSASSTARTIIYKVDEFTPDNLEKPNTVFHLHGSILDPSQMILTTQDYIRHYANDRRVTSSGSENRVLTFLDFLFSQRNILFIGYGLEELEILEYVISKAKLTEPSGKKELRHFLLQGFFSHEQELARSLRNYYRDCGIELLPFLRDEKDWRQLTDVLEEYARLAPPGPALKVQTLKDMEAMLDE
jgi:hypothetical protein